MKLLTDQRGGRWEKLVETREERDGTTYVDRKVWMIPPVEFINVTICGQPAASTPAPKSA